MIPLLAAAFAVATAARVAPGVIADFHSEAFPSGLQSVRSSAVQVRPHAKVISWYTRT